MATTDTPYAVNCFLSRIIIFLMLSWSVESIAHAKYTPAFSNIKTKVSIYVAKDGSSRKIIEECDRLETAAGVNYLGERKVAFTKTLENVNVFDAFTCQTACKTYQFRGGNSVQ